MPMYHSEPNRSEPSSRPQIKRLEIHVLSGPPGGYGFRTGDWSCEYRGERFAVYASVPHGSTLATQYEMVRAAAARWLAKRGD